MPGNIHSDHARFRNIVKGQVRDNLKKFIVNGDLIGREGNGIVKIPLPYIDLPKFVYDDSENSGIGEGDADIGDTISGEEGGGSRAGDQEGDVIYDAELTLEEIAEIMGEELGLEDLKPKTIDDILEKKDRYRSIRRSGPESLRHFRRTYKQALKRQISSGEYNRERPRITPVQEDRRYRSWKTTPEPNARAVIIHMRDISGSMDDEKMEIVRKTAWWEDLWIRAKYHGQVKHVYIIHNVVAWDVGSEEFFRIRNSSGGTKISSIMQYLSSLIGTNGKYNYSDWNLYPFYYSDGDNFSANDDQLCENFLKSGILPYVNSFCYGHISKSSSSFYDKMKSLVKDYSIMKIAQIPNENDILDGLKIFLGKRK